MVIYTYVVAALLEVSDVRCRDTDRVVEPPRNAEVSQSKLLDVAGGAVDRGLISIGLEARRTVKLTNTSDAPLKLKVLGSSCHCLQHRLASSQIAPGEQTEIVLSVLVAGGFGRQDHFLVLEAREAGSPRAREEVFKIGISFTPMREYEYLPRRFVGTARVGATATWNVYVARKSPGDLAVEDPATDVQGLIALEPVPVAENPTVQRIAMRGEWTTPGTRTGWVTFRTNSTEQPVGAVQATVRVLPAWEATPNGVVSNIFNDSNRHVDVTLRAVVANAPVPAGLDLVQCDPPGILKCVLTGPDAAGRYSVGVEFDPAPIQSNRVAGRALIRVLDDAANLILEVPFVWYRDRQ